MMEELITPQPSLPEMMALLDATMARIEGAYAPSSIRAYRADFAEFARFCVARGWLALPTMPEHLAAFVDSLTAGGVRSSASIRRAVSGICTVHKLNRLPLPGQDPEVAIAMKRMHRTLGRAAKQAHVDDALISRITSHSCRVGAAQDLVSDGATLPQLMNRGRWGKAIR